MGISIEFASTILTLFILVFASGIVFHLKNKKEKNSELKIEIDKVIFVTPDRSAEFYLKITNESNYHRDLYILVDEETVPK